MADHDSSVTADDQDRQQPYAATPRDGGECSSYRRTGRICRSGFIQRHSCWQESSEDVPYCCRDELPERWLNGDGSSKFTSPANASPAAMPIRQDAGGVTDETDTTAPVVTDEPEG